MTRRGVKGVRGWDTVAGKKTKSVLYLCCMYVYCTNFFAWVVHVCCKKLNSVRLVQPRAIKLFLHKVLTYPNSPLCSPKLNSVLPFVSTWIAIQGSFHAC